MFVSRYYKISDLHETYFIYIAKSVPSRRMSSEVNTCENDFPQFSPVAGNSLYKCKSKNVSGSLVVPDIKQMAQFFGRIRQVTETKRSQFSLDS